ncbi:UDP-N-acetylglucosamine--N-acetylmuramyl-(pentapeptide) pyrophosphoryl-undecaprenol N-acetylglucosamine transferase [Candidatus Parcubacteria bacterium]|jgi:UDP-N-acetylglucosamine--N-acetylmuramyl-(pentapeptide) pyrophosphoryl-undecaprenol N-acetylglucosamine transferase|nr:MAG: UDP-N-acetylglucosamine--N-acetylmuramyl-(pentapeptide) pyrophosphoryl-undecaprenol N-acetylglucosamine transferase [Candidatus Parcubacteria bacterium]
MRRTKKIRIGFTGGGTGGHIYPLLAVCDEFLAKRGVYDDTIVEMHYFGDPGIYQNEFEFRNIHVHPIIGSRLRRYMSVQNIFDIPKFFLSIFQSLVIMLFTMPDVLFSKGGPGSVPVVLSAWWYRIPVIIHESDAVPGLGNRISSKFAKRICVAFSESKTFFPESKVSLTGNPIRKELLGNRMSKEGAKNFWRMNEKLPLVLVLGGSQGSQRINSLIIENLAELLGDIQILHQVGKHNYQDIEMSMKEIMAPVPREFRDRYRAVGFMDVEEMKHAFSSANVVVSRAGSGAIFEIASFNVPAVLIPLKESAGDHQRVNAYAYSKISRAQVLEEENMTVHELQSRIHRELQNGQPTESSPNQFFIQNSSQLIVQEINRYIAN